MMNRRLLLTILVGTFTVAGVSAQEALQEQDRALRQTEPSSLPRPEERSRIPELYPGELEDIGPQFLLLEPPRHQFFRLFADIQALRTDNVNLLPSDAVSSDILVSTLEGAIEAPPFEMLDGVVTIQGGLRYQFFAYGFFGDSAKEANGIRVNHNDFHAFTPFAMARWKRDGWFGGLGLRYNHLRSERPEESTFYREWVPNWQFGYEYTVSQTAALVGWYEGNFRLSNTDTSGFVSKRWNDRTDHGLTLAYRQILVERLLLQPYYHFLFSEYTASSRDRRDFLHSLGLSASYYFNAHLSVRVFGGHDWRRSSPGRDFDYDNFNLGGGLSAHARF